MQIVYIRVVDDVTGCISIAPVELHANILQSGTTVRDFYRCDDESNDGIVSDFNLENIANTI